MDRRLVALSRTMARALRHAPGEYGLTLDAQGWAPVADLLATLRRSRRWRTVTADDLDMVLRTSPKQRFERDGGRIRARYGHSVPGRVAMGTAVPPPVLYHGTAPEVARIVLREGLRPMRRQFVHLSADVDTARAVGMRKVTTPVVLQVDAADARAAGVVFYRGNDHVWLADAVPGRFVRMLGG